MSLKNAPDLPAPSRWSLAARLTAWYAVSAFILLAGATGFLYWALVTNLDREDDEYLADRVRLLQALLRDRPNDLRGLQQQLEWESAARQSAQHYVRILDAGGTIVMQTPGMSDVLPPEAFPSIAPGQAM